MAATATGDAPDLSLAVALTPTPAPVGERPLRTKTKRTRSHRNAIRRTVASSVRGSDEQAKAKAWVMEVLADIPRGSAALGDKRKRLEGGVKMGDLKFLPGSKPWATGTFGIDDDIFDLSDSEDAPAWAVLLDLMQQEKDDGQPQSKKRKSAHNSDVGNITSLNDSFVSSNAASSPTSPGSHKSKVRSFTQEELHPRPSHIGAPMFDYPPPPDHQQDGNVFGEDNEESEEQKAFQRELRRTGHVVGSGSWCVPEGDSDEEESNEDISMEDVSMQDLWTQQPPPAPVPAHASLPAPLSETQSAPMDPVDVQRARITKHTPAKPSRLREVHVPSPSVRSDVGNESIARSSVIGGSFHEESMFGDNSPAPYSVQSIHLGNSRLDMPEVEPLNDDEAMQVKGYLASAEGQKYLTGNWDSPIIDFDDDETEQIDEYLATPEGQKYLNGNWDAPTVHYD